MSYVCFNSDTVYTPRGNMSVEDLKYMKLAVTKMMKLLIEAL